MKTKIIQFVPALITLVLIGFSYFSQWCIFTTKVCYGTSISHILFTITQPLYFFSIFFLPIALILIFVSRHLFISWFKLAAWMIPLLFIFIATQPVNATHILSTNRDDATRLAGLSFVVFSLIVLVFSFIRARLYESKKEMYSVFEIGNKMTEFETLFAASLGFITTSIFSWLVFTNSDSFDSFLLTGVLSISGSFYALCKITILLFGKRLNHTTLGLQFFVALFLIGVSAIFWIALVVFAQM